MGQCFKKFFLISLPSIFSIYLAILSIVIVSPTFQRGLLYANKFHLGYFTNISDAEPHLFHPLHISPFYIPSTNDTRLFTWHVLPLALHNSVNGFASSPPPVVLKDGSLSNFKSAPAYHLLQSDPDARLVILFHGNSGYLAQNVRSDLLHSLSSMSKHIHVLAPDYRGYARSTGSPSESGLIEDAISTISYAINELNIPPNRIVIVGQSLGTAVSSAAALYFSNPSLHTSLLPDISPSSFPFPPPPNRAVFAKVILVAPFTNIPHLLHTFSFSTGIPLLSPFRLAPKLFDYFLQSIVDKWNSIDRLSLLVNSTTSTPSAKLNLEIFHAKDDSVIPYTHSTSIMKRLTSVQNLSTLQIFPKSSPQFPVRRPVYLAPKVYHWTRGSQSITLNIFNYGGKLICRDCII